MTQKDFENGKIDKDLYSPQFIVLGMKTLKISQLKILIIGLRGLGIEIA